MAKSPRRVVANPDHPEFVKLSDVVQRAAGDLAVDGSTLLDDLHAIGIFVPDDDSEEAAYFREALAAQPSHNELAKGFGKLAEAPNPLDPDLCTQKFWPDLNAMISKRWSLWWRKQYPGTHPSLRSIRWEDLDEARRAEIRDMCRRLARFHRTLAPANRPFKTGIHTLIHQLADIFASHSGFEGVPTRLPHTETSSFIEFASMALIGLFDPSEISRRALARRWKREKKRAEGADDLSA